MSLGQCDKCQGPLCIRGEYQGPGIFEKNGVSQGIVCELCGTPAFDHPLLKELNAAWKSQPKPSDSVIPPQEYAHTTLDRLLVLEKLVKAQGQRIAILEATMKSQRKTG